MPRKTNDPSAARIRDNQRRSRSRRAGLIQELQHRVREYELKGIAATMEMQHAARKVLHENTMLRNLLAQHNIPQDVIDSHLQSFGGNEVASPEDEHLVGSTFSPLAPTAAFINAHHIDPSHVEKQRTAPHYASGSYCQNSAGQHGSPTEHDADFLLSLIRSSSPMAEPNRHAQESDESNDEACTSDTPDHAICPNDDDCFCAPTISHEQGHASPATEMSCETAASILTDLRGPTDIYSIRISLGCSDTAECMVKTSTVLQMME
ncbi:hypothetical protein BKA65DRAFT_532702 [Rhexocercosporidium sp. MPI-PUGE-AT-0058]|nr:hypothetical protein BKA65DRAFT_532702 [Rhexocercosporidium sp. MPI-PUGE-AT-0058]